MKRAAQVWVTRAEPGATRTAARLAAIGYAPVVAPLLAVRPIPQGPPDLSDVAALAFTSRNGVAAFGALSPDRGRPVLAVGDATAQAARDAGFGDVVSAAGDLAALAALIRERLPAGAALLHPCARDPAGDLSTAVGVGAGPPVRSLPVYEAVETGLAPPAGVAAVLIHSPRAARALAARLGPETAMAMVAVAISQAAAAPLAALPFAAVRISARPDEVSLLATLGKALPPV